MRRHEPLPVRLPAALLAGLAALVSRRLGLAFPEDRWSTLEHGARAAARELGRDPAAACADWLSPEGVSARDLQALASHLAVGESYFYREPAGLARLQAEVLPELIAARAALPACGRSLRIWSAGCATGEEPYTLAMLLILTLGDIDSWDITLVASDINPRFLDHARRGLYREWSFRGLPADLRERFFRAHGGGHFEILPELRRLVTFACHNLAEEAYPPPVAGAAAMDIILCRNVLIYFDAAATGRALEGLAGALAPAGALLLGTMESGQAGGPALAALRRCDAVLYRKLPPRPEPLSALATAAPGCSLPRQPPQGVGLPAAPAEESADHAGRPVAAASDARQKPSKPGEKALLARLHADRGELPDALVWLDRALLEDKLDPEPHYLRASILIELGRSEEAEAALGRVLYLAPDFALAHYMLANLALRAGRPARACKHLDNALAALAGCGREDSVAGSTALDVAKLGALAEALLRAAQAETAP